MKAKILPQDVIDRKTFIKFLNSFRNEFGSHNDTWENNTLTSFLDALEAYSIDIQGYYDNIDPEINADVPSWRVFADILKGASMYE